jgi:hypothetical protein
MKGKTFKKIHDVVDKVVTNKYVLYIVLFIAITHILAYLGTQNFNSLIMFVLAGFLTTYFTKNMVITLLVAISAGNFLHLGRSFSMTQTKEGMKNKDKKGKKKESMVSGKSSDDDDDEDEKPKKKVTEPKPAGAGIEGLESDDDEDEVTITTTANRVNGKSSQQESYDNIHKILGSSNFNEMTKDTNILMKQQNQLAGAINNMAPLLDNAQKMLKGFDLNKMGGLLKNLQGGLQGSKIDKTN